MPNGYDKNWIRLCWTINGFRARFGTWPTRVRLRPMALEDLRTVVLSAESFEWLSGKLRLVPDATVSLVAEDDEGRQYTYGETDPLPKSFHGPYAQDWLGILPEPEPERPR